MAALAAHLAGRVGQLRQIILIDNCSPRHTISLNRLGQTRLLAVVRTARSNGVEYLHYFPFLIWVHDRALEEAITAPIKLLLLEWRGVNRKIDSAARRGRTCRHQGCP